MNGNVWEWTEEVTSLTDAFRNTYGGSYFDPDIRTIPTAGRDTRLESSSTMGFRVAAKGLGLVGDFNFDNGHTVADIDLLSQEVRAGSFTELFDVNSDDAINQTDREAWILAIAGTVPGDVDLNNRVEFADFLVLSGNFGASGGWGDGNFDGSGKVVFADFLILSTNFGHSATVAVPEASSNVLMVLGVVMGQAVGRVDDTHACPDDGLTNRELEVFQMIGAGLTTGVIARKLFLSPHTIDTHREKIKTKLSLKNSGELHREAVMWVVENG